MSTHNMFLWRNKIIQVNTKYSSWTTLLYRIYSDKWDSQACLNSVIPDQRLQNVASDQGLHWLQFIQQFIDKSTDFKI